MTASPKKITLCKFGIALYPVQAYIATRKEDGRINLTTHGINVVFNPNDVKILSED